MALTFRNLLDRLCEMEGTDFANLSEAQKKIRVTHVNAALRWAWKTDNPAFAFPFTVASATRTVTSGLIAQADLGDGTWCSLWTEDPRADGNDAEPLSAVISQAGVHPRSRDGAALTSVFAFYRSAVPAGTYLAGGTYATPSTIPDPLLDMVPLKALYSILVALKQWDSVNALKASYEDPRDVKEALMASLLDSNLVWRSNAVAIASA